MKKDVHYWYSPNLRKDMPIAVYGDYGMPLLLFPTAAADFEEYERFQLIDAIAAHIYSGRVKVYSINSINRESWLNDELHPKYKAIRQVQYNNYIANEVVPYIWNSCKGRFGIITAGASLGAFHCANQLFRRPDLFAGCLAMSGAYDIRDYYKGDYYDENVYFNNPVDYVDGMSDPAILGQLAHCDIHLVTGTGPWEHSGPSYRMAEILRTKGIPHSLDDWGPQGGHDWPYWHHQMWTYVNQAF